MAVHRASLPPFKSPRQAVWGPAERSDEESLYYFRFRGVWKLDLIGGIETHVIDTSLRGEDWRLCGNDVCFLERSSSFSAGRFVRYTPSTRSTHVTPLDLGPRVSQTVGMDVSLDGRWLIYARADSVQSDIMLVENFH